MAELGIDLRQPGTRVLPPNHYTVLYLFDTHTSKGKCEIKMFLTSLWALWNLLFVHSVLPVESVITERTFNLKAFIPIFKLVFSDLFSIWDLAFRKSTLELFSLIGRSRAYRQDIAFEYLDCICWPPEAVIWHTVLLQFSSIRGSDFKVCMCVFYIYIFVDRPLLHKWSQSFTNSKNLSEHLNPKNI